MKKILILISVFFSVAIISIGSIYLYTKFTNKNIQVDQTVQTTQKPQDTNTHLFSGIVTKLNNDLGLVTFTQADTENGILPPVYYSAGVYLSGAYKGYTRVVVVKQAYGPGGPSVYVLATKDFKTYVLEGNKYAADNFEPDSFSNPLNGFDKTKITSVATLDTEQPISIDIDDNFSLFRSDIPTSSQSLSNSSYIDILQTDTTGYKSVTITKPNLSFYSQTAANTQGDYTNYIDGTTMFLVKDETGLMYKYELSLKTQVTSYAAKYQKYLEDVVLYEKAVKANPSDSSLVYPNYIPTPNVSFSSSLVSNKPSLYKEYNVAIPGACGFDTATKVLKNITSADLVSAGSLGNIPLYKLKDTNHALLKQEYQVKVGYDKTFFKEVNKIDQPSYTSYVSKNPLLVLKDPLGRYIAVGEYDYLIPGGCGKPVVYLYPDTPTKVSIKLATPVTFTKAIPSYNTAKGWEVLAFPNGQIQNENNSTENCANVASGFGSEYAKKACTDNLYPYIYWSGTSTAKQYPVLDKGWVVAKADLTSFLTQKLGYMGLNTNEIRDFTSYWIPTMEEKHSEFYRISFLQNKELSALIPLNVNPTPKTSIRVFMDWAAVGGKTSIAPQELVSTKRDGFTLVEWGGLKF